MLLSRILWIFVWFFAHLRILADFQPTSSESKYIPLKCAGMWKQVFCTLRASRASQMLFSWWRAGAGLPVCIVSEALWAQQGAYDRVPASLQGFIAAVSDPEGLWRIESLCLYYKLKPHSIAAFREKKLNVVRQSLFGVCACLRVCVCVIAWGCADVWPHLCLVCQLFVSTGLQLTNRVCVFLCVCSILDDTVLNFWKAQNAILWENVHIKEDCKYY